MGGCVGHGCVFIQVRGSKVEPVSKQAGTSSGLAACCQGYKDLSRTSGRPRVVACIEEQTDPSRHRAGIERLYPRGNHTKPPAI
jgi:hypothetical protein